MPMGDGVKSNLTDINTQLKLVVDNLTKIDSLSKSAANNLKGTSVGGGGGNGNGSGSGSGGGTGGTGTSGNSVMPGAGAIFKGLVTMGAAVGSAVYNGLPNVGETIKYSTGYYNAAVTNGNGATRSSMQKATFNGMQGGLTAVGNDAMVAQRLSASGIAFGTQQYTSTVAGVANAAKYLNMDNSAAVSAITGLKTGSMSATLQRNFGIQTSNYKTGATLTQGEIFNQLASKMQTPGAKLTAENVMGSYQRGYLGANLEASGLSQDQQQLFVQYMLEKSKGNNLNLEDPKSMAKLIAAKTANGDLNPAQAGMTINGSNTDLMQAASDTYIKAQKEAATYITNYNNILKESIPIVGRLKGVFDTLAGSTSTAAALDSVGKSANGLVDVLGGVIGMIASMVGGAAVRGAAGGGAALAGGAGILGTIGKFAKGAGVLGAAVNAGVEGFQSYNTTMSGGDPWSDIWGKLGTAAAGGAVVGGIAGLPAGGVGAVPGALIGAGVGVASTLLGVITGSGIANAQKPKGAGGTTQGMGVATNASPDTAVKFMAPVSAPTTDGFGPRMLNGKSDFHTGLDFACPDGTSVGASAAGTVIFVGQDSLGGNTVKIKHANGYVTWYCHLSAFRCTVGKAVAQGEIIGLSGHTGMALGAHLHFGVYDNSGKCINPASVLNGVVTTVASSADPAAAASPAGSTVGAVLSGGGVVSTDMLIDSRAKNKAGSLAGLNMSSGTSVATLGIGSKQNSNGITPPSNSSRLGGGYAPGAYNAKEGDPYVAKDGPVNVHSGEAILTAEQADQWRNSRKGISTGKSGGNNVTINVTVASASEAEARRFAKIVQGYLQDDSMITRMGKN